MSISTSAANYSTARDVQEHVDHLFERDWRSYSIAFFGIFIMVFGLLGNAFTVFVLRSRSASRRSADSFYLIALAIADTLCLFTGMLRHVIRMLSLQDPKDYSHNICVTVMLLTCPSQLITSWILVAINVEKWAAAVCPWARRRTWFSAALVSWSIAVVFFSVHVHYLFVFEMALDVRFAKPYCRFQESLYVVEVFDVWFRLCMNSVIPIGVFVATYVSMTSKRVQDRTDRRTASRVEPREMVPSRAAELTAATADNQGLLPMGEFSPRPTFQQYPPVSPSPSYNAADRHILTPSTTTTTIATTATGSTTTLSPPSPSTLNFLLVMDFTFAGLVLPRDIYFVQIFLTGQQGKDENDSHFWQEGSHRLHFALIASIAYLNNVVHFPIYLVLSRSFRNEAITWIKRRQATSCPSVVVSSHLVSQRGNRYGRGARYETPERLLAYKRPPHRHSNPPQSESSPGDDQEVAAAGKEVLSAVKEVTEAGDEEMMAVDKVAEVDDKVVTKVNEVVTPGDEVVTEVKKAEKAGDEEVTKIDEVVTAGNEVVKADNEVMGAVNENVVAADASGTAAVLEPGTAVEQDVKT